MIGITGGSGAGKTTLAHLIVSNLTTSSIIVSEDDYYIDFSRDSGFDPDLINYDHLTAHDHVLLKQQLLLLKQHRTIQMPQYCFETHSRSTRPLIQQPADIIIVEGIHCLHSDEIRCLFDFKIYVDMPDDLRLLHRLRRDLQERGRSIDHAMRQYIRTVRPMYSLYTLPSRNLVDLVVVPPSLEEDRDEGLAALLTKLEPLFQDMQARQGHEAARCSQ